MMINSFFPIALSLLTMENETYPEKSRINKDLFKEKESRHEPGNDHL